MKTMIISRLRSLRETAGDLLQKEGISWFPLKNYLLEMEKGAEDIDGSKITDDAEKELAGRSQNCP